jgi:ferredoxin
VRFRRTRAGAPGPDGRPRVEPVPDSEFELPADRVLLCTGQAADEASPLTALRGRRGVFSAGDWVGGPGSLIQAIGHALGVAREVDRFLAGRDRFSDGITITTPAVRTTGRPRERNAIPRFPMPEIEPAARFREAEVETGLGRGAAREEAGRCYFCHYTLEIDNELCIYCDRCLKVTPVEGCIVKIADRVYDDQDRVTALVPSTGPRDYRALVIDQDKCIRCGACAEVCPVECITLQKSARTRVVRA